jgi:hypothetical protein
MNKRGYFGNLIFGIIVIGMALVIGMVLLDSVTTLDKSINSSSTSNTWGGYPTLNFPEWIAYLPVLAIVIIIVLFIWNIFKRAMPSDEELAGDDNEDEDEEEDEESDESEDIEEDILVGARKRTTITTTTKKDGTRKAKSVKLSPGYDVDRFDLQKPANIKLGLKEEDFNKSKYD